MLNHGLNDPDRHRFYVAQSEDPADAGWGLFAKIGIPQESVLCEYYGRINPSNPSSSYTFNHPELNHLIDAYDPQTSSVLSVAGYVNDPLKESRENARWVVKGNKLYLVATRYIRPDEQIFAHYYYYLLVLYGQQVAAPASHSDC